MPADGSTVDGADRRDRPMISAVEILAQLDECARRYVFPMLDNGYVYPADVRLTAYGDGHRWALAIEVLGANPRAGGHGCIQNVIYLFGNCLDRPPGTANGDFLFPTSDGDGPTFDDEYGWDVREEARTLRIRGVEVPIQRDPAHFARKGIVLEEPPAITCAELLRALLPEHRDLLLASEDELRERVSELPVLLRLDEWNHPDLAGDELPSESETFRMLARVLASGDSTAYQPSAPANTHWRHWPDGGTL
jgi:hypothetical protein